jgi:hypothetical protein
MGGSIMPNLMHREREALEYEQALLSELCKIASESKQEMLSYLLGMAYLEVCDLLGQPVSGLLQSAGRQTHTHN